jgi:hypothetical protein
VRGWHFLNRDHRLRLPLPDENERRLVEPGQTLHYAGAVDLCRSGLHSSRRFLDACRYAPGTIVCRVESWGRLDEGDDKLAASQRRCLWMADAAKALDEYALLFLKMALSRFPRLSLPDVVEVAEIKAMDMAAEGAFHEQLLGAGHDCRGAMGWSDTTVCWALREMAVGLADSGHGTNPEWFFAMVRSAYRSSELANIEFPPVDEWMERRLAPSWWRAAPA